MPVGIVVLLIIIGLSSKGNTSPSGSSYEPNTPALQTVDTSLNQSEVASPVVNILCPSTISDSESTGGSGTIITDDGNLF